MRPPEATDADLEALLRSSTPRPDEHFSAKLEQRIGGRPERRRPRLPALAAAGAGATALATALFGLALAGAGPLSLDGQDRASAGRDCRYVEVRDRVRVLELGRSTTGEIELRFPYRSVERLVERCSSR